MDSREYDLTVCLERDVWEVLGGRPSSYARLLYSGGIDDAKMAQISRALAARAIDPPSVARKLNTRYGTKIAESGPNGVIKIFSQEMTVGELINAAVAVALDGQ